MGVEIPRHASIRNSGGENLSFDSGFRLDAALGFGSREPNSWGAELELGLAYNSTRPIAVFEGERLDVYQVPLLVNVIYVLPLRDPIKAWVGVGLGGVYGILVGDGTSILGFNTDYTFGYQASAGLEYSLGDHWHIGAGYKFLGTTDHDMGLFKTAGITTHCFLARLTAEF